MSLWNTISTIFSGKEAPAMQDLCQEFPLIKASTLVHSSPYTFKEEGLSPTNKYYFTTENGIRYEVFFSTAGKSYLSRTLNFGVINEQFEDDEYALTNKGELFRVISTIVSIIDHYQRAHRLVNTYVFSGISEEDEDDHLTNARTKFYHRSARRVVNSKHWDVTLEGNVLRLIRKKLLVL